MSVFTPGTAAWRASLLDASFRGVKFKVEHDSQSGGRRNVTFEFPKRDQPYTEDMGRRAKRWTIAAFLIGPNYVEDQKKLIEALDAENYGTLQHPLVLGQVQANVDSYTTSIFNRERGGICTFEIAFSEAGSLSSTFISVNTAVAAVGAANNSIAQSATSLDQSIKSISA